MNPIDKLPSAYNVVALDSVGSTNEEAKRRAAAEDAAEGTVIWAREQTAGRGRQARVWVSKPGNLYCSIVLRPARAASEVGQIGFLAALAASGAFRELAPAIAGGVHCKWPNDILINGKKAGGILLETAGTAGAAIDWLVVGCGLNLVDFPPETEFPATSLEKEAGVVIEPDAALAAYCNGFQARYEGWLDHGFADARAAWLDCCASKGRPLTVRLAHETIEGTFLDLDEDGALLIDVDGQERRIVTGDVFYPAGS